MQSSDWTHLAHTEWLYTSTAPHHGQLVSSGRYRTCGRVPNMRDGFIVASPFDRPDRLAAPTTGALFHACCRFCRDWGKARLHTRRTRRSCDPVPAACVVG